MVVDSVKQRKWTSQNFSPKSLKMVTCVESPPSGYSKVSTPFKYSTMTILHWQLSGNGFNSPVKMTLFCSGHPRLHKMFMPQVFFYKILPSGRQIIKP